jgi:hypothetical protein
MLIERNVVFNETIPPEDEQVAPKLEQISEVQSSLENSDSEQQEPLDVQNIRSM